MKIATWNVNSIKVRVQNVLEWLGQTQPDIACLQEIKTVDDGFPKEAFEAAGYNVAVHGQKSYNGVAILSKPAFDDVTARLPGDDGDEQARYLEVSVTDGARALRVASIYLPNGNPVDTEKYPYKLGWMERLRVHAEGLLASEDMFVLAGDYNVIPEAEDVHNPEGWSDDALFLPQTRASFRSLLNLGLTDALRACTHEPAQYTFWDYQGGAWQKNHGIRIDHLLLSPRAADRLAGCGIDSEVRAWEKPSDHVPVWADLRM
jgi:exodeoxyribonuclease-3